MPEILVADKPTLDSVKQDTASIISTLGVGKPILLGYRINKLDSNPSTRIEYLYDAKGRTPAKMIFGTGFNYGDWNEEWFVKNNRAVMLGFDGVPKYELNPNDYTQKLEGGASDVTNTSYEGNVMADIPLVWLYQYEDNNWEYVLVSNGQYNENFKAYAHQRADGSIMEHKYLACYKGSLIGDKLRSISGQQPMYSKTAQQEITYAQANGSLWYTHSFSERNLINVLLILMGKSDNSQATFGTGNLNYNAQATPTMGVMKSGSLDKMGMFYGYNDNTHQVKVFGMEGWWADQWSRTAGMFNDNGNVKIKPTPPYNLTGDGYTSVGVTPSGTSGGYIKTTKMTQFGRVPIEASGSDATYLCDGLWFNNSQLNYAHFGGVCNGGLRCGSSFLALNSSPASAYWSLGACLSCEQPT